MSITSINALAVGNALRVFLAPPATAIYWRVMRKATDDISGANDAAAKLIYEGDEAAPLDYAVPDNGTAFYYRAFYWDGQAWSASASAPGIAAATLMDATTDSMELVRDRIDFGLMAEIAAGRLAPQAGYIKVLTAPPVYEDTRWPVVTVHLQSESPASRGIGEEIESDSEDTSGVWSEIEGWLARGSLAIVAWTQNPDERIELRKALRRLIVANLQVFDAAGMVQVEIVQQDIDMAGGEFPAPVYQTMCTLSYQAPVRIVTAHADTIVTVNSTLNPTGVAP